MKKGEIIFIYLGVMFFLLVGLIPGVMAVVPSTGLVYDLGGNWTDTTTHQINSSANQAWDYYRMKFIAPEDWHIDHGGYSGWIEFKYISAVPLDMATLHVQTPYLDIGENVKFGLSVSTDGETYVDIFNQTGPYTGDLSVPDINTSDLDYATVLYYRWYTEDLGGGSQFFFAIAEMGSPYTFYDEVINNVSSTSPFGSFDAVSSEAADMGAALSRQDINWESFEPTEDDYRWEVFDVELALAEKNWIKVFPVIAHWPTWASPDNQTGWDQFADALVDIMVRYTRNGQPRISHWEIWNEPEDMSSSNYYNLLKTAYIAAKAQDPNSVIVAPAMDFASGGWWQGVADLGGYDYLDVFSIHRYPRPISSSPESSDLFNSVKTWKETSEENNVSELWLTEMGWNTDKPGTWFSRPYIVTQAEQARYIVRGFIISLAAGADKVFQFRYVNDQPGAEPYGYGILNSSGDPKLSYYAYQTMTNELEGFNYSSELDLGTNARGYIFTNGTDQRVVVWEVTNRGSSIRLDIDETSCTVVQLDGSSGACSMTDTMVAITLSPDPQFVEIGTGNVTVIQSYYGLIYDTGFEVFAPWTVNNPTYVTQDTTEAHTGNASIKINQQGGEMYASAAPEIKVNPLRNYTLKGWIKTDNINGGGASVNILELEKGGASPDWYLNGAGSRNLLFANETTGWTYYEYELDNIKASTWTLRVYVRTDGGTGDYAWFDDVNIIGGDNYNLQSYGDMESGIANKWQKDSQDFVAWPDSTTSAVGDFSGKLLGTGVAMYAQTGGSIPVIGTGDITYTLSAYLKGENVTGDTDVNINVAQSAGGTPQGWYYISSSERLISTNDSDWMRGSVTLNFADNIDSVMIYIRNSDTDTDSVAWFDEIRFTVDNEAPTITGIPNNSTNEDTAPSANWIDLYPYASDALDSDDELTFSIDSESNSALIDCSISGDRYLDCGTPAADQTGYNDVTVKVTDTGGLTDTDVVRITVNAVNDAPTITSATDAPDPVTEGNDITFTVNWNDVDDSTTKIHLCKTNAITGQTCDGGSWCDSPSFTTDDPASCDYTTQSSGTNKWYYAFACDDDDACSSSDSGTFTVEAGEQQETTLTVTSTAGENCAAGCTVEDVNDRDAAYESQLDKSDLLPMAMSDIGGAGSVSDVKVTVDIGNAESGISTPAARIDIWDGETIYCSADYNVPVGSTTTIVFDCEDNPVSGGLDTVAEVDAMSVRIRNIDGKSADYFEVDYVIVNVTYVG